MLTDKVNLLQKFSLFDEYWSPKIIGELNGQQVKLAKFKGEFIWHHHEQEDELFYEPASTLNTGNTENELTKKELQQI